MSAPRKWCAWGCPGREDADKCICSHPDQPDTTASEEDQR